MNSSNKQVTIALTSIKAAPPHRLTIVSPSDRPLPAKAAAKILVKVSAVDLSGGALYIPVEPGSVLATIPITTTEKGPQSGPIAIIDGDNFKAFHTASAKLVAGLLNPERPDEWPAEFTLKLHAALATDDGKVVVETSLPLAFTVRINR